jgi:multidrug resistance protein MdtO
VLQPERNPNETERQNQVAVLHDERDMGFFAEPGLAEMRRRLADQMNVMAEAIARKTDFPSESSAMLASPSLLNSQHNGEYTRNTIARYEDLQNLASALSGGPSPTTGSLS